jgi:hypothetical protein
MISSTSLDLPEHRKQVIEACQRMDFFPEAIEHLPARDADAIRVSLEMVDRVPRVRLTPLLGASRYRLFVESESTRSTSSSTLSDPTDVTPSQPPPNPSAHSPYPSYLPQALLTPSTSAPFTENFSRWSQMEFLGRSL